MKGKLLRIVRCFAVVTVMAMAWMPVQGLAAVTYKWNIPQNVRVVQTDPDTVDNVRVFSSIQAAINSITDASATNPYLVKVMPGIYDESITLKNNISIEGSGEVVVSLLTAAMAQLLAGMPPMRLSRI